MTQAEQPGAFVYLTQLTPQDFSRLFPALFLPPEEWRRRLRLSDSEFERLVQAQPMRVYIDPVTQRQCYKGEDIRAALFACYELD